MTPGRRRRILSHVPRCVRSLPSLRAVVSAAVMLTAPAIHAATVPTGYQEYFVLGYEQHTWDMMDKVQNGQGGAQFGNGMNSVVTATASADNQVVFYDHWEDGFEADLLNPVQASTLIIGDGDPSNGDACDFNSDPCGTDVLLTGDFVNFASNQGLGAGCTVPSAQPATFTQLCSSVPVNPRCAAAGACTSAEVRFDGGDLMVTSGGPLSVVHSEDPLTQYIGGSTEMLSRQAVEAARSYSVPVGEDLYVNNTPTEPFHYVDLNLVAFEDGTQVFVDSPGAGTASFTLNRGEHWSSLGYVDDGAFDPALALTINAGTKVSTSGPVTGLLFTGGNGTWATRHYALLPDILHSTDYVITAPGDDPAAGPSAPTNRPLVIYIFNPDPFNSIDVTVTDTAGTNVVTVPPNSVLDYFSATGRFVPSGSTVRLTSDQNFWGISAYDYNTNISDWGHSWLATKFLTRNYTVSYAPGNLDPTTNLVNLNGVFIAAVQDNTLVQIDLDGDGAWDPVDTDGDGVVNPAPLPNNTYRIDALAALRVFDPNDFDNTGTRIEANKPVAVAWGQDTDLTGYSDVALDTGYTVYPTNQLFLDPVLVIEKESSTTSVPTSGGTVTYTLDVRSFGFGPLTVFSVYDLLPPGVSGADYVAGSTLVTYPDLTQSVADPVLSIDPATGRDRLEWALSPATLNTNETLTVRYSVAIPAGPIGLLTNEGHAQAQLGGSTFSPFDTADVVRTDVTLTKSTTHDGSPSGGEQMGFTLTVENTGAAAETNVVVSDPIPADTTFLPGSIVSNGPFTGTYEPAQNAVVWTAGSLTSADGPVTLGFTVIINPRAPEGTVILNRGGYESTETPYFLSNEVDPVVVGPRLDILKTGPALLHPNEAATFEIAVRNVGAGAANNLSILDPFPLGTTYVAGSMEWRLNALPFAPLTDAADGDEGTVQPGQVAFLLGRLGANEDVTFRFQVRVDPGTTESFVNNQATVSSSELAPADTNLVQIPIVGDAILTGRVFLDLDGDGIQDPGEAGLANVDVAVVDAEGNPQIAITDANGDFSVTVEPGAATLDVDETDPDFPSGAALTTANDPQVVTAVAGATRAAGPVGYDPPPLVFTKTSNAPNGEVSPGQTVTYTLSVTNYSGVSQTGIAVTDPLPTGTSAVPGSTRVNVSSQALRVTEYFVGSGSFGGTVYDLTLDADLAADYFAIVQGSAGGGGTGGDRDPEADYARLTQDPFASGDLGTSSGSDVLRIERRDGADSWVGVVTVVECLSDCSGAGFSLVSVEEIVHAGAATSGSDTAATAWTDINQVMLMGGFNGAGCYSDETTDRDHPVCHARLSPSGSDQINWTRDDTEANLTTATSTVMVVEWGSEWTVQRVRVTGTNGGNGLNATGEYNTGAISPVARANTWVWGAGHADGDGIGNQAEGVVIALGDGVNQNATESQVAVGTEIGGTGVDFEVWALTHPSLTVDHRFKTDGDSGNLVVDVPVGSAGPERMGLVYNGQAGTSDNYPRPIFSARYLNDSLVRLERRRSGSNFPAWVQGVDFTQVGQSTPFVGGDPANLLTAADGVSLAPGASFTITFQVAVQDPLDPSITQIVNTATVTTDQLSGGTNASATDDVVRPAVVVEPNNAGYATEGTAITYSHVVVNEGGAADSFAITGGSELGWPVELVDPDTGAAIAVDADGNGVWDDGAVNTGSLAPGGSVEYLVRVAVPPGTAAGIQDTTRLVATSDRTATVSAAATDETTVLAAGTGQVIVTPDNSGIVVAGGSIAYTHLVVNNTGAPDTFDLTADTAAPGWSSTIYWDSSRDGVYTPGVDIAITNTAELAPGTAQIIFVVVTADGAAGAGARDVTHLTAVSRNDDTLFGAATDTTTVVGSPAHDLSGGGSVVVTADDMAVHPGTLVNLGGIDDRYNLAISVSNLYGLDGLPHPTELLVDTNGDGVPDTLVASDDDGDGTWDVMGTAWEDTDGNGLPDVAVAAGATLAYELRRVVDPAQEIQRDHVTLTSTSIVAPASDPDNVTATWIFAAVTQAAIRGVRVDPGGEVAFVTSTQVNTASFLLYQTDDPAGHTGREALHDEPVPSPVPDSLTPILYTVDTRPVMKRFVMIQETETDGDVLWKGPFEVGDRRLRRAVDRVERLMDRAGVPYDRIRKMRGMKPLGLAADEADGLRGRGRRPAHSRHSRPRPGPRRGVSSGVKIVVHEPGRVEVAAADLESAGLPKLRPGRQVYLTHLGHRVPYRWVPGPNRTWSMAFEAEGLSTDYSGTNVYVVTVGGAPRPPAQPLTVSAKPRVPGFYRVERNTLYVPSLPEGPDPWQWDYLYPGWPWPDPSWDPTAGDFDLPDLAPGASGPVPVRIQLVGYSNHRHSVTATLNGLAVGSIDFEGAVEATLETSVPAEALRATGNKLSLAYLATDLPDSSPWGASAYLDYVDLAIPRTTGDRAAIFDLQPYQPRLPKLRGVEYLIVTHPLFRAQADRMAGIKGAEGLRSVVVETETAYDRFSGGIVEPRALQALIRRASRASRGLRYVLLVGDDTFDPHDYVGAGSRSFVPSLFSRDATWGLVPSETPFADTDGDSRPDLAIGRLPVETVADAEAVVDKIAEQARSLRELQGTQLAVVDNSSETDAPFRLDAEGALSLLPSLGVRWSDVSQGPAAAREALLAGWQEGAMLTHFFGHAGLTEWADERILTHADIDAHGATWKPTVLLTWACLAQWHLSIYGPALNESLLLQPGGGALAAFGPAGITPPARQAVLVDKLYLELGRGDLTLGEAIQRAKRAALEEDPRTSEVVDGFLLFGDPALRLPWATPASP